MEYLIHPLLDEGRIREPQSRSVLRACKFARQPEESGAQFAQGQALPFFRETCPLKSRDQVVGQPNYFQIEGVGRESTSGNLPERIVLAKLSDAWLHSGAPVVEVPHPRGTRSSLPSRAAGHRTACHDSAGCNQPPPLPDGRKL